MIVRVIFCKVNRYQYVDVFEENQPYGELLHQIFAHFCKIVTGFQFSTCDHRFRIRSKDLAIMLGFKDLLLI